MLTWPGDADIGKACALLLAYIVVGSITGSAIAVEDDVNCWPQAIFSTVSVLCDNELARQAWFFGVGMPNSMLQGPVNASILATSHGETYFGIIDAMTIVITPLIAFFGFAGWYRWASPVAWLLLFALIGEIVYLRMQVPV